LSPNSATTQSDLPGAAPVTESADRLDGAVGDRRPLCCCLSAAQPSPPQHEEDQDGHRRHADTSGPQRLAMDFGIKTKFDFGLGFGLIRHLWLQAIVTCRGLVPLNRSGC